MLKVYGDTTNYLKSEQHVSEPGKGGESSYEYQCATKQDAINLQATLLSGGSKAVIISDPPFWTVQETLSYNVEQDDPETEPTNDWEVSTNQIEQNYLESGRPDVIVLTSKTKQLIEHKLKNPTSELPIVEWEKLNDANYIKQAKRTYKVMAMGCDSRAIFTKTVRRTITVGRNFNCSWAETYLGKVLSKGVLISYAGLPTNIQTILPDSYEVTDAVQDSDDIDNTTIIKSYVGYLDMGVSYRPATKGRVVISQEFVYNKWLETHYDKVTS